MQSIESGTFDDWDFKVAIFFVIEYLGNNTR